MLETTQTESNFLIQITGGTRESANSVANATGIHRDWVWASLLPPEKVKIVDELRWKHGNIEVVRKLTLRHIDFC